MTDPTRHLRSRRFVCAQCRLDPMAIPARDLPAAFVDSARRWRGFVETVLDHPGGADALATRPGSGTWSASEYAGHVRDVLTTTTRQVERILLATDPECDAVDLWAVVESGHYDALCARALMDDLSAAAFDLADLLGPIDAPQLARTGRVAGAPVSVETQVRLALHECRHHLDDARRIVEPARV